jgi:hypothetical protein
MSGYYMQDLYLHLDLLETRKSQLQVIMKLSLICLLYSSPYHTLNFL